MSLSETSFRVWNRVHVKATAGSAVGTCMLRCSRESERRNHCSQGADAESAEGRDATRAGRQVEW